VAEHLHSLVVRKGVIARSMRVALSAFPAACPDSLPD
jgi:hypothetical protein